MSEEHPFLALSGPNPAGQDAAGAVPDALFDLAVNRAAAAVRGLGRPEALAAWHARTLCPPRRPGRDSRRAGAEARAGVWHWAGGRGGAGNRAKLPFREPYTDSD